jgi:hypothetical protein
VVKKSNAQIKIDAEKSAAASSGATKYRYPPTPSASQPSGVTIVESEEVAAKRARAARITTNINSARAKLASNPVVFPASPGSLVLKPNGVGVRARMPAPGGARSDYPSEGGRLSMKFVTKFGNSYRGIAGAGKSRGVQPGWAGLPIDLFF